MGMFDSITCEYELPLPEDEGKLKGYIWKEVTFQSKCLQNLLLEYEIDASGQLWCYETSSVFEDDDESPFGWHLKEVHRERLIEEYHGTVNFYDYNHGDEFDHEVEFKAWFNRGKIDKIELVHWETKDNSKRLERQAESQKELRESIKLRKTFRWKAYRFFWDAPWQKTFHLYRKLLGWLTSSEYRLEKKIRFWSFK